MSALARRAARYASVHGKDYAKDTGNPAATPADIFNNVIAAQGIALAADRLTYSVTYNTENSAGTPVTQNGKVISVGNTVTVTVNYAWLPEAFLGGVNLTSTSVMPMSY